MTSPTIRIARPGPGNGWRADDLLGQAELGADRAHLVLEQRAQRLDQRELQVVGQPADVVVALDVRGAVAAAGLDDVRVERALDQELDARPSAVADDLARRPSNARMNSRPMILRLVSGSVTPAARRGSARSRRR